MRVQVIKKKDAFRWTKHVPIAAMAVLTACATGLAEGVSRPSYQLDTNVRSENQDSRVRFLVIHYTALPLVESLNRLTQSQYQVSSHYLLPDQPEGCGNAFRIFQLVPEERSASHAGVSAWEGIRMLNYGSIGIEIVNLGFPAEDTILPLMSRRWMPYPQAQIDVLAALVKEVVKRHQIPPHRIVGHADIAPDRKLDPGPLFPWETLYRKYRIGAWPDDATVEAYRTHWPYNGDISLLQGKLADYGYDVPRTGQLDTKTRDVVSAFQMHFYPKKFDGVPDVETVARLDALLEKYREVNRPVLSVAQAPPAGIIEHAGQH
jgi:N-acetyl-anhydromuramyl-L-alanine amidase AmpD